MNEAREEMIAEALRPVMREDEGYQVYCFNGKVHVSELGTSVCAAKYPRLYGRLLSVNSAIENASTGISRIPLLAAAAFCIGIRLHWWDQWLGADLVAKLDSAWFFLLVFFVALSLIQSVSSYLQKQAYRRGRPALIEHMQREKIDRDTLVAMLAEDGRVAKVTWYLELDQEAAHLTESEHQP